MLLSVPLRLLQGACSVEPIQGAEFHSVNGVASADTAATWLSGARAPVALLNDKQREYASASSDMSLLDLLATGERAAVDAAFERFVSLWDNAFAP